MTEIKKDKLEEALSSTEEKHEAPKISKEMEIGFHQGTLTTLVNERNELIKMLQQVEGIMHAHIKRLDELGVKIKTNTEKKD